MAGFLFYCEIATQKILYQSDSNFVQGPQLDKFVFSFDTYHQSFSKEEK